MKATTLQKLELPDIHGVTTKNDSFCSCVKRKKCGDTGQLTDCRRGKFIKFPEVLMKFSMTNIYSLRLQKDNHEIVSVTECNLEFFECYNEKKRRASTQNV